MRRSTGADTLFCLHYLGGSRREFQALQEEMVDTCHIVPLDLAGFGESSRANGFSVAAMAQATALGIRAAGVSRWALLGHSMGAKVATALAAQVERGEITLPGLQRLVLLAGSPPSPEPMQDEKRATMLEWFRGDGQQSRREAQAYIEQNVSSPLAVNSQENAIDDLQRMNIAAWTAWLREGSREDWSVRVGILRTPALLIAGADDASLGADAQRNLMTPHFETSRLHVIERTTHLLPMEAPSEVARLITHHAHDFHG